MKWEVKKLSDVFDVRDGTHDSPKYQDDGYPLITSKNLKNNEIDFTKIKYISEEDYNQINKRSKVEKGDLLFAMIGTIGNPTIINIEPNFAIKNVALFKGNKSNSIDFLRYYLETKFVQQKMSNEARGTIQKFVGLKYLRDFPFPVPPLEEQKRIVEILDESFAGIERAEAIARQNLTNASELFDSYLNKIFLDFVERNNTQTLNCITDLIVDCEHKTAPTQETGFPSIRTPNIGKGHLILDNVYRVSEEVYEQWTKRAKPQPGDLILAREAPAGNVGVIPEGERVCLGQRTVLIRPKKNINPQYLAFFLLHSKMQERLLSKSSGATVQHVNMKDIRALRIGDLPPIEIQNRIIKSLLDIQEKSKKLEEIYQRKIEALGELKQSILQKAFSGQLTQ